MAGRIVRTQYQWTEWVNQDTRDGFGTSAYELAADPENEVAAAGKIGLLRLYGYVNFYVENPIAGALAAYGTLGLSKQPASASAQMNAARADAKQWKRWDHWDPYAGPNWRALSGSDDYYTSHLIDWQLNAGALEKDESLFLAIGIFGTAPGLSFNDFAASLRFSYVLRGLWG